MEVIYKTGKRLPQLHHLPGEHQSPGRRLLHPCHLWNDAARPESLPVLRLALINSQVH